MFYGKTPDVGKTGKRILNVIYLYMRSMVGGYIDFDWVSTNLVYVVIIFVVTLYVEEYFDFYSMY